MFSFVINSTYQGPCSGSVQLHGRSHELLAVADQNKTNFARILTGLEEFSNYTVSIETVDGAQRRSPAVVHMFQTRIAGTQLVSKHDYILSDTCQSYNTSMG